MKSYIKSIFLGLVFIFTTISFAFIPKPAFASYDGGNIINDGMLLNASAMSANDIQNFLVGMGSGLATRTFYFNCVATDASEPYYRNAGAPCEQTVLASQIIYYASQIYGINPQAVLATLQKEQSLITTANPTSWQIDQAMGYGCSTTTGCVASNFLYQIDNGVWVLRLHTERARGNMTWWFTQTDPWVCGTEKNFYKPNLYPNQNVSFYDEDNVYYRTHFIANAATSAFYCYTPHAYNNPSGLYGLPQYGTTGRYYSGSYNFVYYFEKWFGSTQLPQPIGASLYCNNGKIYLVSNSIKYHVPDWNMMINYGLNYYPVQSVSDEIIEDLVDGGKLTNLIYDDNGVYLVNNRYRHPISSNMCTIWGLDCMDHAKVKRLGNIFQTQYLQLGNIVTRMIKRNGITYKISNGQKQPIANLRSLVDLGLSNLSIISATVVNSQQPLGSLLMTTPGIVQFSPDPHIYYFNGVNYFIVGDMKTYDDWGLQKSTYLNVPTSSYNQAPPTDIFLNSWAISNNQKYIVDQGRKLLITSTIADIWPDSQYSAPPSVLFNSLPSETMSQLISARPYVYLLDEGKKHYVQTMEEYLTLIEQYGKVTSIRFDKVSAVPQGNDALADGSLIIVQDGSGRIYVVNNDKLTYIPSPSVFNAYGYNWGAVREYSTAILEDYEKDGNTLYNGIASDGTHYIVSGSTLYQLSSSLAEEFGAIDAKFTPISKQSVKRNATTLSRFLLNSEDGRVYYATGGSLHYMSSYESFAQYGGLNTTRASVNTQTIESFTEGQSL